MKTSPSPGLFGRWVLGSVLALAPGGLAQGQATATVTCTVRILSPAEAGIDPAPEVLLKGQFIGRAQGLLLLRIPAGVVRVDADAWDGAEARKVGLIVEVLASRRQEAGRQWFVAREIRFAGGKVMIRDTKGLPLPGAPGRGSP